MDVVELVPRAHAPALAAAHVAVLHGGASSEREVSLITGRAVAAALAASGDGRGPGRVSAVEVDPAGRWRVGGAALAPGDAATALAPLDVVFLGLHGGAGEDGTLQGWLEVQGIAYTGSGARASALCIDKLALRGVAGQSGLAVAPAACVAAEEWGRARRDVEARVAALGAAAWFVKPRCGGSSVATTSLADLGALDGALAAVFAIGDDALVEARVDGVEVSCGVLGSGAAARALAPIEIRPRKASFFDYAEKYSDGGADELCPPRSLALDAVERVRAAAERAHRAAGCAGYSRADFVVRRDGEPVLLEVNTLPGLTPRSLLPQEAAAAGLDYRSLCLWIAADALERRRPVR